MYIYLRDFPRTVSDCECLLKHGFSQFNGAFLIEEIFSRELFDSDEEDAVNDQRTLEILGPVEEPKEDAEAAPEQPPKPREVLFVGSKVRADVYEQLIGMNRLIKKQCPESNFIVKRIKFNTLENPMDIPEPAEEGGEPPAVDEERKAKEFKQYDDFASEQRDELIGYAEKIIEYKDNMKVMANKVD